MDTDTALKMEMIRQLCSVNQQLEKERSNVLCTPSIEPIYQELVSATEDIPVSWLLSPPGSKVCQLLSLHLDSSESESGWADLASLLGVPLEVIRDIKFNRYLEEGQTYTVVWIYAQKSDATVKKLLEALYKMKRKDILQKLHDYATNEREFGRNADEYAHCHTIKQLPNKYQLFNTYETVKCNNSSEKREEVKVCNERLVTRDANYSKETSVIAERIKKKRRYKAVVMLTFAADGLECAKKIAAVLREKVIGVLILDEHRERLLSNPESFITGFFQQVHYVIPIITEGYLRALNSCTLPPEPLSACADARYVKLVYTLMANQYVQNGCINTNVRCILPDGYETLMQEHPVARNRPVLQAWLPAREVEVLAQAVLSSVGAASEE